MESIVYYEVEFNKFSLELFEQQDADCFVGTRLCRKEERLSEMRLDDCEFFAICDVHGDGDYNVYWLQDNFIAKEESQDEVDALFAMVQSGVGTDDTVDRQFDWLCKKAKFLSSLSFHMSHQSRFCLVKDYKTLSAIRSEIRHRKFLAMQ